MECVIRARNVGKKYRLGPQPASFETLRDRLTRSFRSPFADEGRNGAAKWLWALRDVDFDIRAGEVVGVVGRNGAGKSTLLKILARITEPTEGSVELFGRVGSLLEVGTGFHPELSGRENVFLNGAILGMRRREISRKFDEIISFAEVEKFVDTPVKYYSTGMYLRLAFAVAAHLDPEILIVDEVLAVGDTTFQRKCLTKMGAAASEGRTVLFVSHNLAAVRTLCSRSILIDGGKVVLDADVETCVSQYLAEHDTADAVKEWDAESAPQTESLRYVKAYILNHRGETAAQLDYRYEFSIALEYEVLQPIRNLRVEFFLQTIGGIYMCGSSDQGSWGSIERQPGRYVSKCVFPAATLNAGGYVVGFGCDNAPGSDIRIQAIPSLTFVVEILEDPGFNRATPGVIRPRIDWEIHKVKE
jgi:lipopolysaccharide transport system ATP-binding protein